MPRAKRYLVEGYTYHLTHRCHDRKFLLRFARDRDAYREWLRVGVRRFHVPVFAYCVTSNHVHLVAHVEDREATGRLMNLAAGVTARQYNRRKNRSGGFWEDSYQCTAVENGQHLWRCLRYVDLNMVRARKVKHPAEWPWCGYDELTGRRERYRVLDVDRLVEALDFNNVAAFRDAYDAAITESLKAKVFMRESEWGDSVAVGSKAFVERLAGQTNRRDLTYEEIRGADGTTRWRVNEPAEPYGSVSTSKVEPKA